MNLLKDNVPKLVRKLALPAMVGTLFQTLYNIIDTFFAGKISPEALSALSKSFPIYFIIVATSIGVTVAGTALIGNSIGEKDKDKKSKKYEEGVSCPNCHDHLKPSQKERFLMRQKQINLAKKLGKKHIFQKEF